MYALGCLMFRMLCSRPPFVEQEFGQIAIKHLSAPPPRPSQLEPAVSAELEAIVLKLLEKAPDDRYQSCGQLADALDGKAPRPATPVPVPVALPPGARTFVPGELPFDAKDLPINQPEKAAPPPAASEPTTNRKTAYLDPNNAAAGAGPTPAPTPTPAPRSGPIPAPAPPPAKSGPPIALIAIAAAIVVAAVVAGLLLR